MKKSKEKVVAMLLVAAILITGRMQIEGYGMSAKAVSVTAEEVEWNVLALQAEDAYDDSRNAAEIKVAVLDSGLDYDPDIPFEERKDFLGEEEDSIHPVFQDYTGHGTSVASLICAKKSDKKVTGMSANAKLYIARILDQKNDAPISRVVQAIDWAIEKNVKIIHMSFGTTGDYEELHDAIKRAYNNGILIIAAAGNRGTAQEDESTVEYPAAYDEVLSVGATNVDATKTETSSSGTELDVVAPGDRILTTGAFGGVSVQEGTSVAAAQVTGIAATLWGQYPDKSGEFIKGLLIGSANSGPTFKDCGNGQVDYQEAKTDFAEYNEIYITQKQHGKTEKEAISKASRSLDENDKSIRKYAGIGYVNGSWDGDAHRDAVVNPTMTSGEIELVKQGAVKPDKIKGMTNNRGEHPCFHGYGNYFAHTQYMVEVAKAYYYNKKQKLPEYSSVFGKRNPYIKLTNHKNKVDKQDIRTWLEKADSSIFKEYSLKSNKDKGLFFLGCAVHIATDTFSHRGYRWYEIEKKNEKDGTTSVIKSWQPIQHNRENKLTHISHYWQEMKKKYPQNSYEANVYNKLLTEFAIADTVAELPNRYNTAKQVALQVIAGFKEKKNKKKLFNPLSAFNQGIKAIYPLESAIIEFRLEYATKYMNEIREKTAYPYIKKLSITPKNNVDEVEDIRFSFDGNSTKVVEMTFSTVPGQDYIVLGKKGKKEIMLHHERAYQRDMSFKFLVKKACKKDGPETLALKDKQVDENWFIIKAVNISEIKNTTAKMKCMISYKKYGKGIQGAMKKQEVKYGFKGLPKLQKNKFTKKGYQFAGWSLDKKKVCYKNNAKYKFDRFGSVTLYPVFKKKETKKKKG